MRVLYLDHGTHLGGAEVSLLGLLRTLDRERVAPTLACPPGHLADRAAALGVPLVELHLEKLREGWNPFAALGRLRRGQAALRKLLRDGAFDILHANTLRAAAYACGAIRGKGARFVWHVRDAAVPRWARRILLKRCHAAVVPSLFIARTLGPSRKAHVVYNGIDPSEAPGPDAGAAFRRELGIAPEAPVVGCLGRLLPWKGQHLFIEMAARLAQRVPAARFLIVGAPLYTGRDAGYPAQLRTLAAELAIEDRVLFAGHRDDPLAALAAMNVVVNCSRDEPFGRVLIEAMACSRPIVAFESGAVPEIVCHGRTGALVPFGNTNALAEAVYPLLSDPARAAALGQLGRRLVAERFRLDAATRSIEAIYQTILPATYY